MVRPIPTQKQPGTQRSSDVLRPWRLVPKHLMPSGVFDHWLIWDLPADSKSIDESAPEAKRGLNTKGQGYTGPCPPDREHRYFFKLYALDTKLTDAKIANKQDLEAAMKGHILDQAELIGRYVRKGRLNALVAESAGLRARLIRKPLR